MSTITDEWDIGEKVLQLLSKHREKSDVEKIVSVMTPAKNWRPAELATLAHMNEEDALRALHVLEDSEMVISLYDTNEPKGAFWRRA